MYRKSDAQKRREAAEYAASKNLQTKLKPLPKFVLDESGEAMFDEEGKPLLAPHKKRRVNRRGPRPATLEKQERQARYGRWNPENGFCPKHFILLSANGACGDCEG